MSWSTPAPSGRSCVRQAPPAILNDPQVNVPLANEQSPYHFEGQTIEVLVGVMAAAARALLHRQLKRGWNSWSDWLELLAHQKALVNNGVLALINRLLRTGVLCAPLTAWLASPSAHVQHGTH